jgi:hypothetical protein
MGLLKKYFHWTLPRGQAEPRSQADFATQNKGTQS